jgi:hypothetical protein
MKHEKRTINVYTVEKDTPINFKAIAKAVAERIGREDKEKWTNKLKNTTK